MEHRNREEVAKEGMKKGVRLSLNFSQSDPKN